jgi:predicted alpha/beta hydrolase family esterase
MKKQVLFIQGAGDGAYKADKKLADSLQQLLGSSHDVRYPEMNNENNPAPDKWMLQIKEELVTMNDTVILVGHSVGGSILIKFLVEEKLKNTIAGIFLIATPFWGGGGWTYEGYEKLVLPNKEYTKLSNDVPIFLYHSHDDDTVPFAHLALYANRFPNATVRELDERGHQLNNDLTEIAKDIKGL